MDEKGSSEKYEMFAPGDCDRPFPLNPIVDEFLFSGFIGLYIDLGENGGVQKSVLPRTFVWPRLIKEMASINPNLTGFSAQGGIALVDEWNLKNLSAPLTIEIPVTDVDELLATGQIKVDEKLVDLNLDDWTVKQLLSYRSVVLEAGNQPGRLLRLVTKPAETARPASSKFQIDDLANFLSRPAIPAAEGGEILLQLDSNQIRRLRREGMTTVRSGKTRISLSLQPGNPTLRTLEKSTGVGIAALPSSIQSTVEKAYDAAEAQATFMPAVIEGEVFRQSTELAFHLPWRQTWKLNGYSRGKLLNTISLAPQEETTIEVFTWDRRKYSLERSSSTEVDGSFEQSDTTRDTSEVFDELNRSSEFSRQADGRVNVKYEVVNLNIGGAVNLKTAMTSAAKRTSTHLDESIKKATNRIKSSRQTKVSESVEIGREERVTRKVRNQNMCRVLNLDYFEVLSHYEITTSFDAERAGFCVLIQNPIKVDFDRRTLRVYERPLRRALLDPTLADGFSAARLLEARSIACQSACEPCSCPGMTDPKESEPSWWWTNPVLTSIGNSFHAVFTANPIGLLEIACRGVQGANLSSYLQYFRRWAYDIALRVGAPSLYNEFVNIMNKTIKNPPENFGWDDADRLWWSIAASGVVEAAAPTKLVIERFGNIKQAAEVEFARSNLSTKYPTADWAFVNNFLDYIGALNTLDDAGLYATLARFVALHKYTGTTQGQHAQETAKTFAERVAKATEAVESAFDLRTVSEATERENALLNHLNDYANYYRNALWNALPPSVQLAHLNTIIPPGLIELRMIGEVGDRLAFPVIHAYAPQLTQHLTDILDGLKSLDPEITNVTLPTPAVTMETRLGECDGCEEFITEHRKLDLAQKRAEVKTSEQRAAQEKVETERYELRLKQDPPVLDDPNPHESDPTLRVVLEKPE